jgi:hypothetical protein
MARLIRRAPMLLACASLAAGLLTGCGSGGPDDRTQIVTIVKNEGTRPATLCHHLTAALLTRFGGLSNCLSRAASAARDPSTHATAVTVRGRTATAVVNDRTGSRSITLIKQKGNWLISGVR